jgi:phosphatidylserine/phosphatidylglycerophosphate/cardiolipin synthase-like enzyme
MSDFENLLKQTQCPEVSHADMQYRKAMGTMQWFLENDVASHPIHNNNDLRFLVCGEEGFNAIETDLRAATSTIDLVCWGFDPAMELSRMSATTDLQFTGHRHWPRGTTFGDLLAEKGRQGIQVRLLLWYDSAYLDAIKNAPALFGGQPVHDGCGAAQAGRHGGLCVLAARCGHGQYGVTGVPG